MIFSSLSLTNHRTLEWYKSNSTIWKYYMGNEFGCEVCESRSNARYEIEFQSNSLSPYQRLVPQPLDMEVNP